MINSIKMVIGGVFLSVLTMQTSAYANLASTGRTAIVSESAVTNVHFKNRRHVHRNQHRNVTPRERPDLFRSFDRARLYTDPGPAYGPNGERKLRPAFRDGRNFTIFGNNRRRRR